jgi:hypothetical protein
LTLAIGMCLVVAWFKSQPMKKSTNVQKLKALLRDMLWHSTDEIAARVSLTGYNQTIDEARKKHNCNIEKRKVGHNKFEYRLLQTA